MHNKLKKKKSSMELLAPAGSFPAFEAALDAGADAVYVGAPGFNARALSRDFSFAEIGSMIRQAHQKGVKLYIAMNSLVKETELPAALEALSCFEALRPDALIIQDLGLLYLARTWFPDLPLHASTLMSVHNSLAAEEFTRLGFERVVLARELTIEEIAAIHQKTGAELEIFIHGAMCFSYSGLCLFSSLHGGKSSLRGQCVQPCRRHYSWQRPGKQGGSPSLTKGKRKQKSGSPVGYLFSMNDLCGIDMLPAMRDAGVSCLKIEGRLKSAQYVANTVAAYRMALDSLDKPDAVQEKVLREAHRLLDEAMGRKRSSGYLLSKKPPEAITPSQSGNSGRMLGRIKGVQREQTRDGKKRLTFHILLAAQVSEGDRLRLHDEQSGNRFSFTLRSLQIGGQHRKTGHAGQKALLSLVIGRKEHIERHFQGTLFKVDVGSRITAERSGRKRRQQLSSRKVFPDKAKIEDILTQLTWKRGPVALKISGKGREKGKGGGRRPVRKEPPWWVAVAKLSDLRQRMPIRPARFLVPFNQENMQQLDNVADKIRKYSSRILWCLPPVLHEEDLNWVGQEIRKLGEKGYSRFALGHCSQYRLFFPLLEEQKNYPLELYGNYTLNLLNSAALQAAAHLGYQGALFSLESEGENLASALHHYSRQSNRGARRNEGMDLPPKIQIGVYAYGYPPLFTARLDSTHFRYHQSLVSPQEEYFTLQHHDGLTTARATLPFSLLNQRQQLASMGVDFLLLDLSSGAISREAATLSNLLNQGEPRRTGKGKQPAVMQGNFDGVLV
ncbi:MAG: peptidase U32 family protein [Candidatus Electrothrix sp. GW3-4]|uniref:peptidase U32 family protein n=1 Tax=Candidatus Electrothrix sp. GW3-4 TaxID=3126740 RepID=UPI0030CD73E2